MSRRLTPIVAVLLALAAAVGAPPAAAVGAVGVNMSSTSPLTFTASVEWFDASYVEFRLEAWGTAPVAVDDAPPYELVLDTSSLSPGSHTLLVKARNASAYVHTSLDFTVAEAPQVFDEVDELRGLEYADGLQLHLYAPHGSTATDRPAILWIHGGGFTSGNHDDPGMIDLARRFARRGYVAASITYRLRPFVGNLWDPNDALAQAVLDDAAHDAQAAVRWFQANATALGIDPSKIVLAGQSAGAVTALRAATRLEDGLGASVAAVVSVSGTSEVRFATPDDPPALFVHGTIDDIIPLPTAEAICSALADCTLVTVPGAGHFLNPWFDHVESEAVPFLAARLGL